MRKTSQNNYYLKNVFLETDEKYFGGVSKRKNFQKKTKRFCCYDVAYRGIFHGTKIEEILNGKFIFLRSVSEPIKHLWWNVLRTRQWLVWKGLKYVSDWSNEFEREKSWLSVSKSSPPEVFLGKCVLKIFNKFTGERPCRSVNRTSTWVFPCKFAAYFHIICS